jgi:hypothetical protein
MALEQKKPINYTVLAYLLTTFLFSVFSKYSPEAPVFFYIFSPFLFWVFIFNIFNIEWLKNKYLIFLKFLFVTIAISIILQQFFSPSLFGYIDHYFYNETLYGTTSFRAMGLVGSPQNAALFLSAALFLKFRKYNLAFKFIIILAGALTLSTFYGFALFYFFLINCRNKYLISFLCTFIIFLIFYGAFLENTFLEFFSLNEILHLNDRYNFSYLSNIPFAGFGLGANIGNTFFMNNFHYISSESFFFSLVYEQGILGVFKIVFLSIFLITFRMQNTEIANIYRIVILNMCLTPCFLGFYSKILFLPLGFFILIQFCLKKKESFYK